jgi:hypothetical protein
MSDVDPVISEFIAWEQSKRRPTGSFDIPTKGFGAPAHLAGVDTTLWLPSVASERKMKFIAGRLVVEDVSSRLPGLSPDVLAIRARIIDSIQDVGPGLMSIDVDFVQYAAALLTFNYEFGDADLDSLLIGSTAWHGPLIQHLVGGDDVMQFAVDVEARRRPASTAERTYAPIAPDFSPGSDESIEEARASGNWFSRLMKKSLTGASD